MKEQWKLVPVEPTIGMAISAQKFSRSKPDADRPLRVSQELNDAAEVYRAMLEAAPEDPLQSVTADEVKTFQRWAGLDGATAFHLIERHANGWGDVGRMMEAWLDANRT